MRHGRRLRRRPVRRAARTAPAAPQRAQRRTQGAQPAQFSMNRLRVVVSGALFVLLVALKLLLPGGLSAMRGTLGDWLVRDADFTSAFSSLGRAVSGEDGVLESLQSAYISVFGGSEAQEVSAAAEIPEGPPAEDAAAGEPEESVRKTWDYPEHAAAEQRVLGFAYAAPLTGEVTSGFGWRTHPATGREAFHYGVDIAAQEGDEIRCFADGRVGVVAESVELGKYLTVHHENGIVTLYAHCSRITVGSGERVRLGEKLAEAGSTGNATGPHLHFEIHEGEDFLDPLYYLS